MNHRVGLAVFVSTLLLPFVARAQVAPRGSSPGPNRPAPQQAAPQWMYAQTYPSGYGSAPGTPGRGYPAGAVPASYQYGSSAYGTQPMGAMYDGSGAGYGYPAGGYGAGANGYATPGADVPTPLVPTKDNRHYIELGMGAFVPTDRGNTAKAALEANVWALHGGYVPGSGMYLTLDASTGFDVGCMAKSAGDGCKGHLRIHWIGTGAFINTGRPMIASDVSRSWDIMGLTGAEVRVWKGMTLKTTVNWFLPNPWGVYEHEKGKLQGGVSGAISSGAVTSPDAATQAAAEVNPADRVTSVLGHALRHPQINLMAMWEF